ncbi:MAG: PAS domain-containing protein [Deltaproteobacteria bacterium]|nr:PAS domain-containing protein [Deltaproteobacteria bacterium]
MQLQAKYLQIVNILLLIALPVLLAFNIFLLQSPFDSIRFIIVALWGISVFDLWLLWKKRLAAAGQLMIWAFLAGMWAVMFIDQSEDPVARVDTIAIGFAILSTIPLLTLSHRLQLWLFHAVNFIFFVAFCYNEYRQGTMTALGLRDYATDTGVALLFLAVISNAIYTANQRALERIKADMKEVNATRLLLNRTVNSMPSVLMSVDEAMRVTGWNLEAEALTGVASADAMNCPFRKVFTLLPSLYTTLAQVASGGDAVIQKKITLLNDRPERQYNLVVYPLIPGQAVGAVIRMDDVTEQARFEALMVHTEKMISVGGLAAGMAHEINNPLAGILQSSQVLESRLVHQTDKNRNDAKACGLDLNALYRYMEKKSIFQLLDAISKSGKRAARIVDNMLSFARKESGEMQVVRVENLINEALELARNEYDLKKKYDFRKIQILMHSDGTDVEIRCHVSMIQQVLLNILRNGAEAMNDAAIDDPRFEISISSSIGTAIISIANNGPEMDMVVQNRIFEPFFTTKAPGIGTGLGLSVSYFIITDSHKGTLDVQSRPGEGVTFTIELPAQTRLQNQNG